MNVFIEGIEYEVTTEAVSGLSVYTPIDSSPVVYDAIRYIEGVLYGKTTDAASGLDTWVPASANNYFLQNTDDLTVVSHNNCRHVSVAAQRPQISITYSDNCASVGFLHYGTISK